MSRTSQSRRQLLAGIAAAAAAAPLFGQTRRRIRAIAFDAFVLFDPRTILARARKIVGDKGDALVSASSAKLFAYTWFYASAGRYAEFDELAADAFRFAARNQGVELGEADLQHLVEGYSNLAAWPDVPDALEWLRRVGIQLAVLSNLPEGALRANLRAAGIDKHFRFVLSTDKAQRFKPAPKAYDLALRAFQAPASQIGFAASAGWDAAGASWFGFPTVWVNRGNTPAEEAYIQPRLVSAGMDGVRRLANG